jgi:phospholipase D1/2
MSSSGTCEVTIESILLGVKFARWKRGFVPSRVLAAQSDQQSGVTFHEAQVALAKVYVGSDDVKGGLNEVVNIEKPHDERTSVDQIGKKDTVEKAVRLPKTVEEAKDIIKRFQDGAVKSDKNV